MEELSIDSGAAAFSALLDQPAEVEKPEETATPEAVAEPVVELPADEAVEVEAAPELVTVKIDGKEVQVPLDEVKAAYQKDKAANQRFEQAAELRKTADAEIAKAQAERQAYAQNLQTMRVQLEGALQAQQQSTDWEKLLAEDPVEFLKQKHLAEQRQVQLQRTYAEQQRVNAQLQAEHANRLHSHIAAQREELLAKLPAWKDEAKAKAETSAIRDYLQGVGYGEQEIAAVTDARGVLMARKAMLYDQMVSKAQAAAKKVSTLPTKVERPGVTEVNALDKRSSAFQRLAKSGRVEDAAAAFASLL